MNSKLPYALMICALVTYGSGCGGGGQYERVSVSGRLLLDEKPLDAVSVFFEPVTSGTGERAVAEVHDGVFSLDEQTGPSPGSYRVRVQPLQMEPEELLLASRSPESRRKRYELKRMQWAANRHGPFIVELKPDIENHVELKLTSR